MARVKEEDLRLNLIINGDETRKNMGELREEMEKDKKKISELENERKKLVKQYGEESIQVRNLDKSLEAHRNGLKNLGKAYSDYERRLSITGMNMKELSAHARNVSAILRNLDPRTKEWQKYNDELKKTRDRMRDLKAQSDATKGAMSGLVGGIRAAYVGIAGVVYGVARAFSGAVNTMKDFEQANVNLSTILGVSTKEMEGLTSEALRLGGATRYTASEVTGLQTELAKLGFNQSQIKAMEEPVLNFATAVGAQLPEAAAMAGAALRMFELNSTDTEDTLAALAISTNKSALNFSYLQTAMSIVGPVAKTFGFGIKDTTALLGALANAGFDASSAATATRNIFLKMADANGDLAKSLGGSVKTFDDLIVGLKTLSENGIDLAGALELTDKRSVAAFTSFLSGADAAKELRGELDLTDGALKAIAEERMNTLEGSILTLKSAWERLILSLRGSTGILKKVTDALAGMVQAMTDLITGGQVRHENSVNQILEDVRFAFGSDEKAAEHLGKEIDTLQGKADSVRTKLEGATRRKERKQLEKELKDLEERISRGRDAIGRLNIAVDESGNNSGDGGNGGGGGGDDDDKKNKKTWSLNSDKTYLKQKAQLTEQFNNGEIESEEKYLEALYQAEISAYKARLALHKEKGAERAKIEADLQAATLKHTKDVQKRNEEAAKKEEREKREILRMEQMALQAYARMTDDREERAKIQEQAEDERYQAEKERYEKKKEQFQNYAQIVEALELQHQNNLRRIRLEAIEGERREEESIHNERLAAIRARYAYELNLATTSSAERRRLQREEAKEIAAENLAYLKQQAAHLQTMVTSGRAGGKVTDPKLSAEQLQSYKTKLQELLAQIGAAQAEVENLEGNLWGSIIAGTGDGSFLGVSQSDWELFFQNLADGALEVEDLQTMLAGLGDAAQKGLNIASKAIDLTNAKEKKTFDDWSKQQDERQDRLQKRLDDGLMSQAQFDAEVDRMQKEKQAKEDKMKLDQAERQKKLSIVQSIINTALGVTQTLAQWGIPWGLVPAATMTAMGVAETAMIASQPVGYEKGGQVKVRRSQDGKEYIATADPDKRGFVDKPTILVGEAGGEYVIPADGVKNPSIAPILARIENARRLGTLKSLNLEAAYPAAGYARGGYTPHAGSQNEFSDNEAGTDLTGVISAMNEILRKMDKPVPAIMSMTGPDGFEEVYAKRQEQRNRGKIG